MFPAKFTFKIFNKKKNLLWIFQEQVFLSESEFLMGELAKCLCLDIYIENVYVRKFIYAEWLLLFGCLITWARFHL